MEREMTQEPADIETRRDVATIAPSHGAVIEAPSVQELPCPTCAAGAAAESYVYAIGRIEARFPNLGAEKNSPRAPDGQTRPPASRSPTHQGRDPCDGSRGALARQPVGTSTRPSQRLTSRAAAAPRARGEANRSAACQTCPSSRWPPPDDRELTARLTTGTYRPVGSGRNCRRTRGTLHRTNGRTERRPRQSGLPVRAPCRFKSRERARENPECSSR